MCWYSLLGKEKESLEAVWEQEKAESLLGQAQEGQACVGVLGKGMCW